MKKTGLFIVLIFLSSFLFGQDFDNILTKKQVDCPDVSYNCGLYFVKYMEENKLDSAKSLIQYWESKCGMREPIYRAKILLALKQNLFSNSLLAVGSLNNIFNYQNRMEMIKYSLYFSYDKNDSYFGYIPPGQEFDKYTQELAKTLMKQYNPNQIEYQLAEFYGENCDTIFSKIQTKAFENSALKTEYELEVNKYLNMSEFHVSWITGIWIPTGALIKIGSHPELGFQMGIKDKKMNYDLTMTFKFNNSPHYYYATRTKPGSVPELTNYFFGGHIGLDVGRDLFSYKGHELQLTGGIAFDGFDVLEEDVENDIESASTATYNFNIGIGYRYYITNTFYLGVRAKYNIVDYSLNKVINFTGNPITIQFLIGGLMNDVRNNNLKALKYKLRK